MNLNFDDLLLKNVQYAKMLDKSCSKLKKMKNMERNDLINEIKREIECKINRITQVDVDFHQQMGRKALVEMIENAEKTEVTMFNKLFDMLEEYKKESTLDKENREFECSSTHNGRKRKLN